MIGVEKEEKRQKEGRILGSFEFDWLSEGIKDLLHLKVLNNKIK